MGCVDFAVDVAVGVASPAVAGAASLADFSGVVTLGVAPLAVSGAASPAVAGMASRPTLLGVSPYERHPSLMLEWRP